MKDTGVRFHVVEDSQRVIEGESGCFNADDKRFSIYRSYDRMLLVLKAYATVSQNSLILESYNVGLMVRALKSMMRWNSGNRYVSPEKEEYYEGACTRDP
ncbi:hypothetical protein L1987_08799 [Smallanthus sonchifolius]|uniref:Uncharacterized protein n=1 Tax=Smallanthus sonchifolius TaxID=185202 RepID=A0ACB9JM75_9ASTR|nr:hypothetical protein L1987_08799 [Smallanthus sonchifolius]